MSDAEVERLFRAIEALRMDVQGYRTDLHELDKKITEIEAREDARHMSKGDIYKFIGAATMIISTATAIAVQIFNRL